MAVCNLAALCALLVAASFCHYCEAFAPHYLATLAQFEPSSMDHKEITEAAALEVVKDLLLTNPNREEDSTTVINSLTDPGASSLFAAYYHGSTFCFPFRQCFFARLKYKDAVETIADANADVDDSESKIPSAHFDNEQIFEGNRRLQELKSEAIANINARRYSLARENVGRALHSLQDFYSHSNWVELGNTEPLEQLGKEGYVPNNVAGPSVRTCTGCEDGDDVNKLIDLVGGSLVNAEREYNCMNNLVPELADNNVLTTGYTGRNRQKPAGKCSHGGLIDSTSDLPPTGGIAKDSKSNTWSPHFYLHDQAASVGKKATVQYLQDIRSTVGDMQFAEFLNIELAEQEMGQPTLRQVTSSIAFVIDTTGSMGDQISQILRSLSGIQTQLDKYNASLGGRAVFDFILAPFGDQDPGVVGITQNITELAEFISQLEATVGSNCAEPSIGALITAATHSRIGSTVIIYTDASPSDGGRLSEAESLIREKSLTVNSILLEGCRRMKRLLRRKRLAGFEHYQFLAAISGGQVLEVSGADLTDLSTVVIGSIKPSITTIFQQAGSSDFSGSIDFPIDSTISEFFITVNGDSLNIQGLISPQGQNVSGHPEVQVSLSSSSAYVATVNTSSTDFHGIWQLRFNSSSMYRVLITADSTLSFTYTLYRPSNETRTGLSVVRVKALQGELLLLAVQTDTEMGAVDLRQASILNSEGFPLANLNLTSGGSGFYDVEFEAPGSSFQIQVTGVDNDGFPLSRISSSGMDTTDIQIVLGPDESPYLILRTGDNRTLSLLLYNFGPSSTFEMVIVSSADSSPFSYSLTGTNGVVPFNRISLGTEEVVSINLEIQVVGDVTDSDTDYLTIIVSDVSASERNDFINIEIAGTTLPPIDPTDINYYNDATGQKELLSLVILLSCVVVAMAMSDVH